MARQISINDKYWPEVDKINSYAIFMGYLLMGVRGLGFLILTWTTVVLLGGFVSILQKDDFWCLTVITLVQIAGVFDFLSKEKSRDVANSFKGLLYATSASVLRPFRKQQKTDEDKRPKPQQVKEPSIAREVLASVLAVVQWLVFVIVLCPLAVLYVLGLYVSAGTSLWRLIQQDYGNGDGGGNLIPALNILYSLAMAQGVVYGYRTLYDLVARIGLVELVAHVYSLETDLVSEYLDETVAGCMKNPSFARERNLVTYAVDLLVESKSRYSYISGVLILGKMNENQQQGLMKQLLTGSASFSHIVKRLLKTFGPISPYNTEIRVRAARIVANVADSIHLDQFPAQGMMMIHCISSLLDTSEEYSWRPEGYERRRRLRKCMKHGRLPNEYERDWLLDNQDLQYTSLDEIPSTEDKQDSKTRGYKGLVVQGLCILQGLAVDEDNCRVISKTQGLLSKAIAPLLVLDQTRTSDNHDREWSGMAEESLLLMKRLMATPYLGETERKLRNEIHGNIQAIIRAVKGILKCVRCRVLLKRQAVEVLLDLSADAHTPASIMPGGSGSSSTMFLWILMHISLMPDYHFDSMCGYIHLAKKSSYIASLAGKNLQALLSSQTEASTPSTLRSVSDVIRSLTTAVADAENNSYIRIHAATILEHLVSYYTKDDEIENLKQLKKAMTDVMPEVLKEIVVHARDTKGGGIQAVTEANNGSNVLLAEGPDLEQGGVPHDNDNGQESSSTPHQQKGKQYQGIQLQETLFQLCLAIKYEWIDKDQHLTRQFNGITAKICSAQGMPHKTFRTLVDKVEDKL